MKEYHLHPDKQFIIRENDQIIGYLEENEIPQFAAISLPEGCTEILVASDGIVYATINKAMEGISHNPLTPLIVKQVEIIAFYEAKKQAQQLLNEQQEPQE